MIDEKIYQYIYDEISKYIPKEWEKLVLYLEYGEDSYSFSFFVKIKGEYVKCYDLPGVSDNALAKSFKKIDKKVLKEREKISGKWSNMTMLVTSTGDMHTDFDYTDMSQGNYQYKKNWKKKYLV